MTELWRLLGPLGAFTAILMFGVSTAPMSATVNRVLRQTKSWTVRHPDEHP